MRRLTPTLPCSTSQLAAEHYPECRLIGWVRDAKQSGSGSGYHTYLVAKVAGGRDWRSWVVAVGEDLARCELDMEDEKSRQEAADCKRYGIKKPGDVIPEYANLEFFMLGYKQDEEEESDAEEDGTRRQRPRVKPIKYGSVMLRRNVRENPWQGRYAEDVSD